MKKLVALFLCVIVAFPVFAKNDKDRNEFSITYGQYSSLYRSTTISLTALSVLSECGRVAPVILSRVLRGIIIR